MSARTCSPRRVGQPGWPPPHPRRSASAVFYRPGRLRRAGVGLPLSLRHLLKPLRSVKRRAGPPSGCPRRLGWGRHAWASSPLDAAFVSQTGGQVSAPAHSGDAAPRGEEDGVRVPHMERCGGRRGGRRAAEFAGAGGRAESTTMGGRGVSACVDGQPSAGMRASPWSGPPCLFG